MGEGSGTTSSRARAQLAWRTIRRRRRGAVGQFALGCRALLFVAFEGPPQRLQRPLLGERGCAGCNVDGVLSRWHRLRQPNSKSGVGQAQGGGSCVSGSVLGPPCALPKDRKCRFGKGPRRGRSEINPGLGCCQPAVTAHSTLHCCSEYNYCATTSEKATGLYASVPTLRFGRSESSELSSCEQQPWQRTARHECLSSGPYASLSTPLIYPERVENCLFYIGSVT